jgi:hypothetical protein
LVENQFLGGLLYNFFNGIELGMKCCAFDNPIDLQINNGNSYYHALENLKLNAPRWPKRQGKSLVFKCALDFYFCN